MRGVVHIMLCITTLLYGESFSQSGDQISYENGRRIFETNCSPCHDVHREIVGPALASIPKKRPESVLMAFIRNSQRVITSGDKYTEHLFDQYNHQVMPSFTELSDKDIRDILTYIGQESVHPTEPLDPYGDAKTKGTEDILLGESVFSTQCANCHQILQESSFAPALASVTKRRPRQWLHDFIRNSQKVVQSGDEYAVYLFNSYEQRIMVPMEFLSEKEIDAVLAYVEFTSSSEHAKAGVNGRESQQKGSNEFSVPNAINPWKHDAKILFIIVASMAAALHAFLILKLFRYLQRD